jgi:hypothetical protein
LAVWGKLLNHRPHKDAAHKLQIANGKRGFMNRLWVLLIALSAFVSPLMAQNCTNGSLIGEYGFQEQGQFPGGGFSEFRAVGTLTFDGKGNAFEKFTIWYSDFQVTGGTQQLSYSVGPDCTFNSQYVDNGETFSGVIVDNGRQIRYLETTGDPMRSGEAVKVKSIQNTQ